MTQDILTPIEAVDMMHHFEGSRRQPYYDPVRLATIGVGHLIKPGEAERFGCRAVNGRVEIVDPEFALTPDEVEQLFLSDLAIFERALIPLVMATTGLSDAQEQRLEQAAASIPVVWAPNMSLAVNLTMKLSTIAAEALKDYASGVDVEIIERHHRFKEDSPSGTALKFGALIADVMGQTKAAHGREGRPGPRPRDEIGYHAVRVGDNPGEHTIIFGMLGETIELRVGATNRDCYALGALAAAKFAARQKPGLYNMYDVLGL